MTKWALGLLLVMNIAFFALMQWGGALTGDTDVVAVQAPLNVDKIRLVGDVVPSSAVMSPMSAVASASATPLAPASILDRKSVV